MASETALPTAATLATTPLDADRLPQTRWAARGLFATLGLIGGAWGAHIPSIKAHYALNDLWLAIVLLAGALGAVSSLFFAGRVIARLGVRRAAQLAAAAMTSLLAAALQWPGLWALLPAMAVFGAAMSLFDVAINAEGTVIENLSGRRVMSNLHALFSVGGMLGAGLCALLLGAAVPATWQLAIIGAGVMLLAGGSSCWMLAEHPPEEAAADAAPQAHFAWPRGTLLVIGLLILAGMTAEGVMYDWCVLYLKQELQMPQARAALGFSAFSAAMALARFGADALRERFAEARLLAAGALLAAVAMAAVLLIGDPTFALIGYALVGAGLAPVVPILFSAATRVPGVSRAAAIASVSSIGYAGFMIGPPLIGGIAQAASLTAAMGVVVLAAAALAIGARRVP